MDEMAKKEVKVTQKKIKVRNDRRKSFIQRAMMSKAEIDKFRKARQNA